MKISILTMFNGLSTTYSLVNVVADQIAMLLAEGMEVELLVSEHCPEQERWGIYLDKRLKWRKIINSFQGEPFHWQDYSMSTGSVHESFYREVDAIARDFCACLADTDVCILHDILYQGWHLLHNAALRKAQPQLPHVRFLSFTHSLPFKRPETMEAPFSYRFTDMPNTIFVYPTVSGLPALAAQYGVPLERCATVYNSLPLLESLTPAVQQLAHETDLLSPEILCIYPARLTPGKQFEKVAALLGAIKSVSKKIVKVIFCDFPCTDIPPEVYQAQIRKEGYIAGLTASEIVFTSDCGFPTGFPRQGVLELFQLSTLYLCPSYSESFGLTVLEAGSKRNFLVLNEAVPALKELGESLGAYFMRWDARNFGFDTKETYHPSEKAYYEDHALKIFRKMEQQSSLRAKTIVKNRYNLNYIAKQQLLPLLKQ